MCKCMHVVGCMFYVVCGLQGRGTFTFRPKRQKYSIEFRYIHIIINTHTHTTTTKHISPSPHLRIGTGGDDGHRTTSLVRKSHSTTRTCKYKLVYVGRVAVKGKPQKLWQIWFSHRAMHKPYVWQHGPRKEYTYFIVHCPIVLSPSLCIRSFTHAINRSIFRKSLLQFRSGMADSLHPVKHKYV